MAIEEVWIKYSSKHDFHTALKKYKGTISNYKSYTRTLTLYKRIEKLTNKGLQ